MAAGRASGANPYAAGRPTFSHGGAQRRVNTLQTIQMKPISKAAAM